MAKKSKQSEGDGLAARYPGFDLDEPDLPKAIDKAAFSSGGYPYDDKLKREKYEKQLLALQIELCKLQAHVKKQGERIAIVFEGRDSAGKGG